MLSDNASRARKLIGSVAIALGSAGAAQADLVISNWDGYMAPEAVDSFSAATENGVAPLVGYLPGKVPWTLETRLRELGANVTGSEKGTVLVDRELITGDSPNAENKIAAVALPLLVAFAEKAKNKA